MTTTSTTEQTLIALNDYEAVRQQDEEAHQEAGRDIWQDVILRLDGYDEAATDEADPNCASNRFVSDGVLYEYVAQVQELVAR